MALDERLDAGRPHAPSVKAARCAVALFAALTLGALPAQAQPESKATPAPVAKSAATPPLAANATRASAGPRWKDLTADQKQALAPLASHWNRLHVAQKRKWLALSRNFDDMTEQEKATLRGRMIDWASLSPQERTRARLNYAEVERLAPADERKAKWEAYQALSDEERRQLADRAATRLPGAAVPAKPVPQSMLAPIPPIDGNAQRPPRIQIAPH